MFKKAAAVMIMLAICFSGVSCAQKNGYKTSGKPYSNESPDGVKDGFYYKTEENQTDNFIAYKDKNGETMLFIMREGKISHRIQLTGFAMLHRARHIRLLMMRSCTGEDLAVSTITIS